MSQQISNVTLVLIAFFSCTLSRLLEWLGLTSLINFVHFPIVICVVFYIITQAKISEPSRVTFIRKSLIAVCLLFLTILMSALFNSAGLINGILYFLLLGEPFIFFIALASISPSAQQLNQLRYYLIAFALFNMGLAFLQHYLLIPFFPSLLPPNNYSAFDLVQGAFLLSGAGGVNSSALSLLVAIYYFRTFRSRRWLNVLFLIAALWQVIISDSKQVLVTCIAAWIILNLVSILNLSYLKKILWNVLAILLVLSLFITAIHQLEVFRPFRYYSNIDIFQTDSREIQIKTSSLDIIPSHYKSPINVLVGLGPGHTVSRLGGWMLDKYHNILTPLGATQHPASQDVWNKMSNLSIAKDYKTTSTFFSPLYSWAGIWGDLGLTGLFSYLGLGYLIWHHASNSHLAKFYLLNAIASGFILTYLEEPGYTLSISMLLSLLYHENNLKEQNLLVKGSVYSE